ncbi:MAG TPA: hypothetical protein VK695_10070 [Steroidobacteraceae bacterium]|jgi:alkyl hydroperoxide reductase subunit AhpC|nr:hypothetical protein [Steroidobacteraceae bacterium]
MATLLVTAPSSCHDAAQPAQMPLREWMHQSWVILFSHPGDFVRCDLEIDRWLSVMQRTFAGSRIKLLELRGDATTGGDSSWVNEVSGDQSSVRLCDARAARGNAHDLQLYALREEIMRLGPRRYVMIVDDAVRIRRTFSYSALAEVPSPLEFLGWAAAARAKSAASAWACERRAAAL